MPPKVTATLLWIVLACAVAFVAAMTWHPWVIGTTDGCPPGAARAWDGHCYASKHP